MKLSQCKKKARFSTPLSFAGRPMRAPRASARSRPSPVRARIASTAAPEFTTRVWRSETPDRESDSPAVHTSDSLRAHCAHRKTTIRRA